MIVVPFRVRLQLLFDQIIIKSLDVVVRDIIKRDNFPSRHTELQESVVACLTVISLVHLAYLCPIHAELDEGDVALLLALHPIGNGKDVDIAFIYHVVDDLPHFLHQLLQRFVKLRCVKTTDDSPRPPVPLFRQYPDS